MAIAQEPNLDDILRLLQAALALADGQDESLIAIRVSDALNSVIARIDQKRRD